MKSGRFTFLFFLLTVARLKKVIRESSIHAHPKQPQRRLEELVEGQQHPQETIQEIESVLKGLGYEPGDAYSQQRLAPHQLERFVQALRDEIDTLETVQYTLRRKPFPRANHIKSETGVSTQTDQNLLVQ